MASHNNEYIKNNKFHELEKGICISLRIETAENEQWQTNLFIFISFLFRDCHSLFGLVWFNRGMGNESVDDSCKG